MSNDIISKIRAERIRKKITQDKVAKFMNTTGSAVARIESGGGVKKHSPSLKTLQCYAAAVGLLVKMDVIEREDVSDVKT